MIKNIIISTLLLLFSSSILFGQLKPHLENLKSDRSTPLTAEEMRIENFAPAIPTGQNGIFQLPTRQYQSIPTLVKPISNQPHLKILTAPDTGLPYVIEGTIDNLEGDLTAQSREYLEVVGEALQIEMPSEEFVISKISMDNLGQTHIRLTQQLAGIPVYGSEILLHQQNGKIRLFNGRYYPTPDLENLTPTISQTDAQRTAKQDLETTTSFKELTDLEKTLLDGEQMQAELVIYHKNRDTKQEHLAWHFTIIPNVAARWSYFVDAHSGEILHQFSHLCKLGGDFHKHHACEKDHAELEIVTNNLVNNLPPDGPTIANANDLFSITRTINTYEFSNTFFMIDASRAMFNGVQSNFPDEPVGTIWTIDAQNTSPSNNDFAAIHVTSNNNSFNNPRAVSAHYNGGKAYEYFLNTFGRNSINGQGGNIVSLVNVADENGSDMDNAFWSGSAMFYGNGNQAFSSPLSKALDVAGHEMSHGVVQTTANLEYQGESGALNESFADIFGAMIDRDDWKLGEDVVNPNVFNSGALRDMQNPNNGGSSLNDAGYQPAHVDEQYFGSQNNGGVHINSGIPNRAYYLFATAIGKDKAEQIYYRALTEYLVKSSQFVDLRIAVVQAATDLHGANSTEVNAAKDALSGVGIGEGAGTQTQTDVGMNNGEEYVLMSDGNLSALYIFQPDGTVIENTLTDSDVLSKPSVTDDGSFIVFVDGNKNLQAINYNWSNNTASQQSLSNAGIWRNVAVSKDGTKLAALTDDFDGKILVFDLVNGDGYPQEFDLYTPTTSNDNQTTDEVQYADVLEWDFTGEWIMYDAYNEINNANGEDIDYWDIGFIKVYENSTNGFGDGFISKLFSGLPENTNVANPTFSKNSDYIIALDYVDVFNFDYEILGVNTETGDVGLILEHDLLGYPSFSVSDDQIVYDDVFNFSDSRLSTVDLQDDKISGAGNVEAFIDGGKWGTWFADGERVLTNTKELFLNGESFNIYPNPFADNLKIELDAQTSGEISLEVFNVIGQRVFEQKMNTSVGKNSESLNLSALNSGTYFLKMTKDGAMKTLKISKF